MTMAQDSRPHDAHISPQRRFDGGISGFQRSAPAVAPVATTAGASSFARMLILAQRRFVQQQQQQQAQARSA